MQIYLMAVAGWCGYLYWNIRVFNSEPLIDKITSPVKVIIAGGIAAFIIRMLAYYLISVFICCR
jgi:hypothetical protein